mgnify:CR=1 FL=1
MIALGKYNNLEILRDTTVGLFLGDDEGNDVLLPNKYVPEEFEIGDRIEVFCYLDHEERIVATTLVPYVTVDQFQLLQVAEVNEYGWKNICWCHLGNSAIKCRKANGTLFTAIWMKKQIDW